MVRQAGVAPGAAQRDVENAAWTAFGMPRSDLTAQRSCVSVFQNRQDLAGADIPKVDSCVCVLQEYIVLRVSAPLAEHFLVVVRKLLRHIGLLKVPPGALVEQAGIEPTFLNLLSVSGRPHPAVPYMCPAEFHRASGTANHRRYRGAASYGLRLIF